MKTEIPEEDLWSSEKFEHTVTSALISFYENGVHNNGTFDGINQNMINAIRKNELYIPGPDRIAWQNGVDGVDGIPDKGVLVLPVYDSDIKLAKERGDDGDAYVRFSSFRKIEKLPNSIHRTSFGVPYEQVMLYAKASGGFEGNRFYFVLDKKGNFKLQNPNSLVMRKAPKEFHIERANLEAVMTCSMNFIADKKHTWCITAEDGDSKVTVGANFESVKSLLFSRELPMTPTGRKRPILHLVHAHQRRMREGVEIDIDNFLRGTREIVMDGTKYSVAVPNRFYETYLKDKYLASA